MIFNDEFLFIHVPKTAGMSVSDALLNSLRGSVHYAVQEGHGARMAAEKIIPGKRHQTLASANLYFKQAKLNHRVENFKYVMAMVRNPYEMEVSRYHYLRKGHLWDKGLNADLALAGNFADFVAGSRWWFQFRDYYTVNGIIPENLYIVRFENFEQTIQLTFGDCFHKKFQVKRLNKSHSTDYRRYYTDELEELVYKKYQWIFDKGYYPRESFGAECGEA